MAQTIKGITIEFRGETTELERAISTVTKETKEIDKQLTAVNKSLKFNPDNVELLTQKEELLTQKIEETKEKLDLLNQKQAALDTSGIDKSSNAYMALRRQIIETESKLTKFETDLNEVDNKKMDSLESEVKGVRKQLKKASDSAEDAADSLETMAEVSVSAAIGKISDALSGVSDKLTGLGTDSANSFTELEDAASKITGYLGLTGDEAEAMNNKVKELYETGLGDSMDSCANAILAVKTQLGDVSDTDLSELSQQVLILEDTFGIDMNESLRGVNALMTSFGLDAQTAMDYLVKGTQNGLDKTDELGDNLSEYSAKFAEAGYSADEYFQLLQNGLSGGAYNLDKVNDAINEVTTRLGDGTIEGALTSYSTETQNLFTAWQNGGATQKEVINSIVSDISNCTNQQEQLTMATTAFGTMAEDGGTKMISSLTTLGDTYNTVTGSANDLNNATTTSSQEIEANLRQLKDALIPLGEQLTSLALEILPPLVSAVQSVASWLESLPAPVAAVVEGVALLVVALTALSPIILSVVSVMGLLNTALAMAGIEVAALAGPIAIAVAAMVALVAAGVALYQNWDTICDYASMLKDSVVKDVKGAVSMVKEQWDALVDSCARMKNNAVRNVQALFKSIKNLFTKMGNVLKTFGDTITDIADKFKEWLSSLSNFQLPHIKTPHFKISPSGWQLSDLLKGSIPSLNIEWYKKGGIFNSPSVIGVGEAGAEAVLPIEKLNGMFDRMAERINSNGGATYNIVINSNSNDGNELAREFISTLKMQVRVS